VNDHGVVHRRYSYPVPHQAEVGPVDADLAVQPHFAVDAGDPAPTVMTPLTSPAGVWPIDAGRIAT
jgi:hypothetical protein